MSNANISPKNINISLRRSDFEKNEVKEGHKPKSENSRLSANSKITHDDADPESDIEAQTKQSRTEPLIALDNSQTAQSQTSDIKQSYVYELTKEVEYFENNYIKYGHWITVIKMITSSKQLCLGLLLLSHFVYPLTYTRIAIAGLCYSSILVILSLVVYVKFIHLGVQKLRTAIIYLIKYSSMTLLYTNFLLFALGIIHKYVFLFFLLFHFLNMIFKFTFTVNIGVYMEYNVYDIFEAAQILFIVSNLLDIYFIRWDLALLIFEVVVKTLFYLSCFICFLAPIYFGIWKIGVFHAQNFDVLKTVFCVFSIIVSKSISAKCLLYLLRFLVIGKTAQSFDDSVQVAGIDFRIIAIAVALCGAAEIIVCLANFHTFRYIISKAMFINIMPEGVQKKFLSRPLDLEIILSGTNFYTSTKEDSGHPGSISGQGFEAECMICYDNKACVLIRDCNHGGMCEKCTLIYLTTKDDCPICKQFIKKVYVFDFDASGKKYLAKNIISRGN